MLIRDFILLKYENLGWEGERQKERRFYKNDRYFSFNSVILLYVCIFLNISSVVNKVVSFIGKKKFEF